LVNNAGRKYSDQGTGKVDVATWQKTIDANLTSAWLMTREVAPIMLKKGGGAIVNTVSVYGFIGAAAVLALYKCKGWINYPY